MTKLDTETRDNERHYADMLREIEQIDPTMLLTVVPGSQLHQRIQHPGKEVVNES